MSKVIEHNLVRLADNAHANVFKDSANYKELEYFLECNGIDVRYIDSDQLDGYLRWNVAKNKPVIAISIINNDAGARRFIMACLLGHLLIDWNWKLGKEDNLQAIHSMSQKRFLNIVVHNKSHSLLNKKEQIYYNFAVLFLIPEYQLVNVLNAIDNLSTLATSRLINIIAYIFKTSTGVATVRLNKYFYE